MSGSFIQLGGVQLYEVSESGPEIRTGQDAVDLMSAASEQRATWIAIPVARLGDELEGNGGKRVHGRPRASEPLAAGAIVAFHNRIVNTIRMGDAGWIDGPVRAWR